MPKPNRSKRFRPIFILVFLMMAGTIIADAELWGRNANQYLFPLSYNDSINITDKTKNSSFAGDLKVFGKFYLKSTANCQILNTTPNGRVQCSTVTGANGGTVTSVTAGKGLSSTTNPITTSGTLSTKANATVLSCSNITNSGSGSLCQTFLTSFSETDPVASPRVTKVNATERADNSSQAIFIRNLFNSNGTQALLINTLRTDNSSQSALIRTALNNNATINIILAYLKAGNLSQSIQIQSLFSSNTTQASLLNILRSDNTTQGTLIANLIARLSQVNTTMLRGNSTQNTMIHTANLHTHSFFNLTGSATFLNNKLTLNIRNNLTGSIESKCGNNGVASVNITNGVMNVTCRAGGSGVTSVTRGRGFTGVGTSITTTGTLNLANNSFTLTGFNVTLGNGLNNRLTLSSVNITNKGRLNNTHTHSMVNLTGTKTVQCAVGQYLQNITLNEGGMTSICQTDAGSGTAFTLYNYTKSDVNSKSATAPSVVNTIPLTSGKNVEIECLWMVNSSAGNIGARVNTTWTGTSSRTLVLEYYSGATALATCAINGASSSLFCIPTTGPGAVYVPYRFYGYGVQSGAGVFTASIVSETGASALATKGSWCRTIEKP